MKKKATEDQFNELHNLVTKEFLTRIKSGEATTQDLKAACDWLKANDISGVVNPTQQLSKEGLSSKKHITKQKRD